MDKLLSLLDRAEEKLDDWLYDSDPEHVLDYAVVFIALALGVAGIYWLVG